MANRIIPLLLLSLSWLACRPLALQMQASTPHGALISIAGNRKCGTSHLYMLLSSHRDVFSLRKERCPRPGYMNNSSFARYLSFTASLAQAENGSSLRMENWSVQQACVKHFGPNSTHSCRFFYKDAVSGGSEKTTKVLASCLSLGHATFMQHLAPVANVRVLFTQRDPADMFWSAYNFWVSQIDNPRTVNGTYGEWTNKLSYRSPKHFHELVQSEGRLAGGVSDWFDWIEISYMRSLRWVFGRDQVLFLRSEDLKLHDTVQKIYDFVGLDIDGIDPELIDSKTNSQGHFDYRGMGETSHGDEEQGLYEVSGFQPMLCETRKLIYKQARGVCSELDKEFGLRYEKCLDPNPACP